MKRLIFFGHHKCASQYIKAVFRQSLRLVGVQVGIDSNVDANDSNSRGHTSTPRLKGAADDALCFDNATPDVFASVCQGIPYRGFHVIRDPRDIIVSAYFSHRYSHPILFSNRESIGIWRQRLSAARSVEEGLLLEIGFAERNFRNIALWNYANPLVYETTYEILTFAPQKTFRSIFEFLGIDTPLIAFAELAGMSVDWMRNGRYHRPMRCRSRLPLQALQIILWRNSFRSKSGGRRQGDEDRRHHYRKGIAGDWRNYFTPSLKAAFRERYPGLLVQLGYEQDDNW